MRAVGRGKAQSESACCEPAGGRHARTVAHGEGEAAFAADRRPKVSSPARSKLVAQVDCPRNHRRREGVIEVLDAKRAPRAP